MRDLVGLKGRPYHTVGETEPGQIASLECLMRRVHDAR